MQTIVIVETGETIQVLCLLRPITLAEAYYHFLGRWRKPIVVTEEQGRFV